MKMKKTFPRCSSELYSVTIPEQVLKKCLDEYQANIRQALKTGERELIDSSSGLLCNRLASWSPEFINELSKDEDLGFAALSMRNHNEQALRDLGVKILSMLQEQKFTVSETILFFRMLEGMALASPLEY